MPPLSDKYRENIDAADKLIRVHQLYASSVHCSYYACVQAMKFIYIHRMGKTEEDLKMEIMRDHKSGSIHTFLSDLFVGKIRGIDRREALNFRNWLKDLRHFRVESDYKDISINQDKASKAKHKAESILETLKENCSL